MAELTENRVREIIKEERSKDKINVANITVKLDGEEVARTICKQIRLATGKRI